MARLLEGWETSCIQAESTPPVNKTNAPTHITSVRMENTAEALKTIKMRIHELEAEAYRKSGTLMVEAVAEGGAAARPKRWERLACMMAGEPVELVVQGGVYSGGLLGEGLRSGPPVDPVEEDLEDVVDGNAPSRYCVWFLSAMGKKEGEDSYYTRDQLRIPDSNLPRMLHKGLMDAKLGIGLDMRSVRDFGKLHRGAVIVFLETAKIKQHGMIKRDFFRWGKVVVVDPHRQEIVVNELEEDGREIRDGPTRQRLLVPYEEIVEVGCPAATLQTSVAVCGMIGEKAKDHQHRPQRSLSTTSNVSAASVGLDIHHSETKKRGRASASASATPASSPARSTTESPVKKKGKKAKIPKVLKAPKAVPKIVPTAEEIVGEAVVGVDGCVGGQKSDLRARNLALGGGRQGDQGEVLRHHDQLLLRIAQLSNDVANVKAVLGQISQQRSDAKVVAVLAEIKEVVVTTATRVSSLEDKLGHLSQMPGQVAGIKEKLSDTLRSVDLDKIGELLLESTSDHVVAKIAEKVAELLADKGFGRDVAALPNSVAVPADQPVVVRKKNRPRGFNVEAGTEDWLAEEDVLKAAVESFSEKASTDFSVKMVGILRKYGYNALFSFVTWGALHGEPPFAESALTTGQLEEIWSIVGAYAGPEDYGEAEELVVNKIKLGPAALILAMRTALRAEALAAQTQHTTALRLKSTDGEDTANKLAYRTDHLQFYYFLKSAVKFHAFRQDVSLTDMEKWLKANDAVALADKLQRKYHTGEGSRLTLLEKTGDAYSPYISHWVRLFYVIFAKLDLEYPTPRELVSMVKQIGTRWKKAPGKLAIGGSKSSKKSVGKSSGKSGGKSGGVGGKAKGPATSTPKGPATSTPKARSSPADVSLNSLDTSVAPSTFDPRDDSKASDIDISEEDVFEEY